MNVVTKMNQMLAKEMEGNLYEHIYLVHISSSYFLNRDYYTVYNGIVYCVNGGTMHPSDDSLEEIKVECHLIGKFVEGKVYKRDCIEYSSDDLKKLLKL